MERRDATAPARLGQGPSGDYSLQFRDAGGQLTTTFP
jgi:hypothetical protein